MFDPTGNPVKSEYMPIPAAVLKLKERDSKATNELVFEAQLPALGFPTYFVKANGTDVKPSEVQKVSGSFGVKSKNFNVIFDKNGNINTIQLKNGKVVEIKQEFEYYKAKAGDNKRADHRASGAYIFRPDGQTPNVFNETSVEPQLVETFVATEIHQKINSYNDLPNMILKRFSKVLLIVES